MKILSFEVVGFLGKPGVIKADFHEDLNIITGRNGSGKTSLLKLLWYIISGNIFYALREVPFSRATVHTTEYTCSVIRTGVGTCRVEMTIDGTDYLYEDHEDEDGSTNNAEDIPNSEMMSISGSVFLPTFRRIEGGFTLSGSRVNAAGGFSNSLTRQKNDVEDALLSLSRKISNLNHIFVSTISTVDIVQLLLQQYAELSEQSNTVQASISQGIIDQIKSYQSEKIDSNDDSRAQAVLQEVRSKIESMDTEREAIMLPLEAIREIVARLFTHTGIKFSNRLSFGDAATSVNSDMLSAGEKQMLSFICYNALHIDEVIFIDEPELSLHVDWQRQLFPILESQGTSNQFIIATHSPFIYSKYPDKEILISDDRGDNSI